MDVAEDKTYGDERIALSGVDDEIEEVEEEIEQQQEEEEEQFSERRNHNVESAGDEIKQSIGRDSSPGKIFVGGVAWETTEETFTDYFKKYGEITDSVIMKDKYTKRPRGFGFITFADPAVVDKVLEEEHVINERQVEVKRTVPREDMHFNGGSKTKKIFVGGIPSSFSEDELKEYFSSYGEIVEHQIMLDHNSGRSRGFGFVTFKSEDTVDDIISEGKTHELGGKQVEVKKAEPKRSAGDRGDRGFGDRGFGARAHYGSSAAADYGGYGSGVVGGYGGGYRSRGGYGGYGEGYGASLYGGYGYGYGNYGFGGPMYGGSGEGVYGSPGGYGGADGYGSRVYGSSVVANGRYHPYGR
ncbi:heterogeneous nuclear ribonucleoprotein 1 [Telopea speciosissima]|uniref:heterogeneous nuclear ribonucleoprotein 1 n=1 Tax=Telopea speciosissima TaxID=54955 RepID=UPI001CC75629|nr:heterogeneous nuclear ribonucleoprotein 1 [Telopea speciosissima]XP_043722460.1 heterogeneous nuclear ribonucleoprotein 1 [Telopea speciosissima]